MSSATLSRRARYANDETVNTPATPESVDMSAAIPVDLAPTIQETLNAPTPAPLNDASQSARAHANVEFDALCVKLDNIIRAHSRAMVGFYVDRGAVVCEGINVKLSLSRNASTRKENRASAIRALTISAESAYDPDAEPAPKLDRWIAIYQLCQRFPTARSIASTRAAENVASLLYRVDPPASWDAPETYAVKRHIDPIALGSMIDRIVTESPTIDTVSEWIDALSGKIEPQGAPTDKPADLAKAGESAADRIVSSIVELKIDPVSFFSRLSDQMGAYGWKIENRPNDQGISTLRPIKTGR